mgnify:CR=1 FL=1|tara:strand:- start:9045 stop:10736 length:1692 start_codon:yes stop_codon:yes gene_type:complete
MYPLFIVLLAALLMGAVSPGVAQTLPADRDLIQDRQQRLLEEQRRRLEALQNLPGARLSEPPRADESASVCFDIQEVRLSGASLMTVTDQQLLLSEYIGLCLGSNQLNEALKAVTDWYLQRGYVTARAYLPEQDLSRGILEIVVIEGTLEGLDSSALATDRELAMAFPGKVGSMLNLRELEQLVDQMGRLPSRKVQLELLPGEEVGGSRVRLQGELSKPWQVGLARHNDGQRNTGEQQWDVSLLWDSPLGLGDQLRLRGGGDAVSDTWKHSANQSLFYGVPYGWWTFNYSYSQSYYRTRNQASGFSFTSDGESKRHQLNAERVVHRDAVSKSAVNFGLAHLRTRNYIENSLLQASSHRLSESQFGLNHGRRLGSAFVNLDAGWQRGTGAFDAQANGSPRGSEPVARYNKYTYTVSYLQPFRVMDQALSVDSLLYGQRSEDVLFGPQRMSIGGLASVRGFKDQSLAGDSGFYWRSNLRWRYPLGRSWLTSAVQELGVSLGYDLGQIRSSRHNSGQSGRMTGNALELSLRGKHLAAGLTFAQSLNRPGTFQRDEHPVYFRVDVFF